MSTVGWTVFVIVSVVMVVPGLIITFSENKEKINTSIKTWLPIVLLIWLIIGSIWVFSDMKS